MAISYIGGKSRIAQTLIIPNIPTDIENFVEVFGGMFWVFFKMDINKYPNLKKIIYNDSNALNSNLFKCIKDHQTLLKACDKLQVQQKDLKPTPDSCKSLFNEIQSEIYADGFVVPLKADYDLAAKYVYVLTQVFSGSNPTRSKFIDLKGKYHSKFTSFKNKLRDPKWQKLFESVTNVENLDFVDVIKKYDGPNTYFYCDPPYYRTEKYYANHDFGVETHEKLAECLKSIEGKFSLSYYDFPQLSEWFPRIDYTWLAKDFHKASAAKSGKMQTKGTELLIMNY